MPMGVVEDDDFEAALNDCGPIAKVEVIDLPTPGRKEGDVNVPDSIRSIIGETSEVNGRQDAIALAKTFGLSESSVSAYANGASSTATYDNPKPSIVDVITKSKQRIGRKAAKIAIKAVDNIDDVKLSNCSAVELAQVAKSMGSLVSQMSPDESSKSDHRPQIIQFFAPPMKTEQQFETIMVKE